MINFSTMSRTIRCFRKISTEYSPEELCPEAWHELHRMQKELAGMITTLPDPTDRIIMSLVFLKGQDYGSIAEGMDISERNVFYHMKRGKTELLRMYPGRITLS